MTTAQYGIIDELLNSENPISTQVDGAKLAQHEPHSANVVTAQAVPVDADANFSVNVEVAVRGRDGNLSFSTLRTLTPAEPAAQFSYSVGCAYRMNYTGGTGTVLARMRG